MTLEKLYLRQIGLFEVGKFAKKPYFRGFAVVPKEPHPSPYAHRRNGHPQRLKFPDLMKSASTSILHQSKDCSDCRALAPL
jgi:hypothetical protein